MLSSSGPIVIPLSRGEANSVTRKNSGSKRRGGGRSPRQATTTTTTTTTARDSPTTLESSKKNFISLVVHDVRKNEMLTTLQVRWWDKISDIKVQLRKITNESLSRHHLYLPKSAKELSNNLTMHDIGFVGNSSTSQTVVEKLRVIIDSSYGKNNFSLIPFNEAIIEDVKIGEIMEETRTGLASGQPPGKTDEFEGSGGVYFMRSSSSKYGPVAVFKPLDEEPGMSNNPKGRANETLREYFAPGQGCFREVAAYVFDVKHFCNVPPTALVYCEHPVFNVNDNKVRRTPKVGSLQAFLDSYSDFEGMSTSLFSDFEIQKIALLDLRILNCDRNSANILVRQKETRGQGRDYRSYSNLTDSDEEAAVAPGTSPEFMSFDLDHEHTNDSAVEWELIPIDHGYSMPSRLKVCDWDWVWFGLPAVKRPICPEIREYVKTLDIDKIIAEALEFTQLSEDCIYLLRCAHHFVVSGIENGLTLHEIASLMARVDDEAPSKFESAFNMVEENAFRYFNVKSSSHGHSRNRQQHGNGSQSSLPSSDSSHELLGNITTEAEEAALNFSTGMEGAVLRRLTTLNDFYMDSGEVQSLQAKPMRLPSFEEEPSPSGVVDELPSPLPSTVSSSSGYFPQRRANLSKSTYPRSAEKLVSIPPMNEEKLESGENMLPVPFNLSRVVSFSGFENAKIYNQFGESDQRALKSYAKSRDELINSSEFKKYRLDKMIEAMSTAISKVLVAKSSL